MTNELEISSEKPWRETGQSGPAVAWVGGEHPKIRGLESASHLSHFDSAFSDRGI